MRPLSGYCKGADEIFALVLLELLNGAVGWLIKGTTDLVLL